MTYGQGHSHINKYKPLSRINFSGAFMVQWGEALKYPLVSKNYFGYFYYFSYILTSVNSNY